MASPPLVSTIVPVYNAEPFLAAAIDSALAQTLAEQEIIIRHICVEGWDYIGQWSGPNLRNFFERVGADMTAKYVYFICADDYTESIDMATALHPQTILATKYAGDRLADPFGYPMRARRCRWRESNTRQTSADATSPTRFPRARLTSSMW